MAKRYYRRSVSITGALYVTAKAFCEDASRSVSGLVEELLRRHLHAAGIKVMSKDEYKKLVERRRQADEAAADEYFTF